MRRAVVLSGHIRPQPVADESGPLCGVRILDMTQMVSGPMATSLLGDQGADVIKVESPNGGDQVRNMSMGMSSTFAIINRNKRSLAVDAKKPQGLDVIKRLAATSDVMVQNMRPGAAERMGLGYDDLCASGANKGLIYVSISGFGETGPYSQKRVYDPVIQAVSGLASLQTGPNGRPSMMRCKTIAAAAAVRYC